ncbi:MAG: hypothetical protein M0R17_02430 [Candidatus Omnitrophica bacterium]|jgi:hypothetical protein|nr:hypothetical protein [Candidatus Omnitrophota bacterium]
MAITTYNWVKESGHLYDNFNTWVTNQEDNEVSVAIGQNIVLTGDLTIPSGINIIEFYNGAGFYGPYNLTISRMTAKPRHQIFNSGCTCTFQIGAIDYLLPEWFGSGNGNLYFGLTNTIPSIKIPLSRIYIDGGLAIGDNINTGNGNLYVNGSGTFGGNIHLNELSTVDGVDISTLPTYISNTSGQLDSRITSNTNNLSNTSGQLSTRIDATGLYNYNLINNHSNLTITAHGGLASGNHNHGLGTSGKLLKFVSSSGYSDSMINDSGNQIYIGSTNNYVKFNENGYLLNVGSGKAWRDEIGSAMSLQSTGPGISLNISGGTIDYINTSNYSDFATTNVQLNHDIDSNCYISPHLHYIQSSSGYPNWVCQYRWQTNGQVNTVNWSGIPGTGIYLYTTGTLNQIFEFRDIYPPTQSGMSDIVQFRLIRDANNASGYYGGSDSSLGTVSFTSFDVHVCIDSFGSRQEWIK